MCSVPTSECNLNECTACPGTSALMDFITSVIADQCISRVEFQTWQQTDRSTIRTEIIDAEDFAEITDFSTHFWPLLTKRKREYIMTKPCIHNVFGSPRPIYEVKITLSCTGKPIWRILLKKVPKI